MTWLVSPEHSRTTQALRDLLGKESETIQVPGTHDALTAIIAENQGFKAIYLSGGAFSASLGLPDLGLITLTELVNRTREITRAANIPLIVDIDTGFGSVLNVARTARELVDAGAAGIQIEDQVFPKKCGHLNGKALINKEEMVEKIHAIRKMSSDLVIIARTDAYAVEGLDSALERAIAYKEAGADVIFPEALHSEEEFREFYRLMQCPLLLNMTEFGVTPYYDLETIQSWGYKIIIYPVTSLRIAAKAVENVFKEIKDTGSQKGMVDKMQTRKELYKTIKYFEYEELDSKISKTKL